MVKANSTTKVKREDGSRIGALMLAFVAFIVGYLVATLLDNHNMQTWLHGKLAKTDAKILAKNIAAKKEPPKAKLEFYTLLSKDHRHLREAPPVKSEDAPPDNLHSATKSLPVPGSIVKAPVTELPPAKLQHKYVLQVASFKNKTDAEKMRADLLIKGFDVLLVTFNNQQQQWYRVMVGPVPSAQEAENLRADLALREHINGMIRKVDV